MERRIHDLGESLACRLCWQQLTNAVEGTRLPYSYNYGAKLSFRKEGVVKEAALTL